MEPSVDGRNTYAQVSSAESWLAIEKACTII